MLEPVDIPDSAAFLLASNCSRWRVPIDHVFFTGAGVDTGFETANCGGTADKDPWPTATFPDAAALGISGSFLPIAYDFLAATAVDAALTGSSCGVAGAPATVRVDNEALAAMGAVTKNLCGRQVSD